MIWLAIAVVVLWVLGWYETIVLAHTMGLPNNRPIPWGTRLRTFVLWPVWAARGALADLRGLPADRRRAKRTQWPVLPDKS